MVNKLLVIVIGVIILSALVLLLNHQGFSMKATSLAFLLLIPTVFFYLLNSHDE